MAINNTVNTMIKGFHYIILLEKHGHNTRPKVAALFSYCEVFTWFLMYNNPERILCNVKID